MGKVLIIDDEPDILKIVSFRINKLGHEAITAADGEDGFSKAKSQKPDLIFMDLRLPKVSGQEICRKLADDADTKGIPVVIFTASVGENVQKLEEETGAQGFVAKPFNENDIIEQVKRFVK